MERGVKTIYFANRNCVELRIQNVGMLNSNCAFYSMPSALCSMPVVPSA